MSDPVVLTANIATDAAAIYRDNNTPGDVNSGEYEPYKPSIRALWAEAADQIQDAFNAGAAGIKPDAGDCACATLANITLSGEQTIDGVTTAASRVLVKAQTLGQNNGIYVSGAGAWTRATDSNSDAEVGFLRVRVNGGTTQAYTTWQCDQSAASITAGGGLGTTVLTFKRIGNDGTVGAALASEVTRATAAEALMYQPRANIVSGAHINAATAAGMYAVFAGALDAPTSGFLSGTLEVSIFANRWVVQRLIELNDITTQWARTIDTAGPTYGAWNRTPVSSTILTSSNDLNTDALSPGEYLINSALCANTPIGMTQGMLTVKMYAGRWIVQTIVSLNFGRAMWRRTIDTAGPTFELWAGVGGYTSGANNQIIPTLGDSVTQFNTYQGTLGARTSSKIMNCGIAGSSLTFTGSGLPIDQLSGVKLVDAIISNNWTAVDAAITALIAAGQDSSAFIATLKTIDFTTIKYMTMWYGTNDYAYLVPLGANTDNIRTTFKGAINYVTSQMMTAYPNLQIIWITPMWRARLILGDGLDSDTNTNGIGLHLLDYVDAYNTCAPLINHLPALDMYRSVGINKYNNTTMLVDGLHPTTYGGVICGNKIGGHITGRF